jgi:hypothetical protein
MHERTVHKKSDYLKIKIRTMGTISKGILGGFSGTVGTVVGSTWKGIAVMKSRPGPRKGSQTVLQLEQQARFALMIKFLQPLTSLFNQTFNIGAVGMSGFNKAFSYNVLNAVTGAYPAFTINYAMLLLSRGDLPNAPAPAVASPAAGKLAFTWTDNSGIGKARATDKAVVAVFCEELNHWIFNVDTAARNAGTYTLDVLAFSGKPVQSFLGFISADGKFVSNSQYMGVVNVL